MCKSLLNFFGAAVSLSLFLFGLLFVNANLLLLGVILLIVICAVNCLGDLEHMIALALYLICFFTFMLGEAVMNVFLDPGKNSKYFDALVLIYIAMAGVCLGAVLYQKCLGNRGEKRIVPSSLAGCDPAVQKVSVLVFYATMLFRWMVIIEKILVVRRFGYIGLYTNYNTVLPWFVHKLSVFNETAFFIYLVTFPSKRQTYVTMSFFLFGKLLDLLTGVRGDFLMSVLLLLLYVVVRNAKRKDDKMFSGRWARIAILFMGVFLVAFMGVYSSIRKGEAAGSLLSGIATFFSQQGVSINVVQGSVDYQETLRDMNKYYSAYPLLNYNAATKWIGAMLNGEGWGLSDIHSSNLGHSYTYLVDQPYQQMGGSYGTAYLGELYLDYSYPGVFLFNVLLGFLLRLLCRFEPRHWIWNMYCMYSLRACFFLPRDCSANIVTPLLSFSSLLLVLFILFLSSLASDQMMVGRSFKKAA